LFAAQSKFMKITTTRPSTGSGSHQAKSNSVQPGGQRANGLHDVITT
jgi:hypothetical protein